MVVVGIVERVYQLEIITIGKRVCVVGRRETRPTKRMSMPFEGGSGGILTWKMEQIFVYSKSY